MKTETYTEHKITGSKGIFDFVFDSEANLQFKVSTKAQIMQFDWYDLDNLIDGLKELKTAFGKIYTGDAS